MRNKWTTICLFLVGPAMRRNEPLLPGWNRHKRNEIKKLQRRRLPEHLLRWRTDKTVRRKAITTSVAREIWLSQALWLFLTRVCHKPTVRQKTPRGFLHQQPATGKGIQVRKSNSAFIVWYSNVDFIQVSSHLHQAETSDGGEESSKLPWVCHETRIIEIRKKI